MAKKKLEDGSQDPLSELFAQVQKEQPESMRPKSVHSKEIKKKDMRKRTRIRRRIVDQTEDYIPHNVDWSVDPRQLRKIETPLAYGYGRISHLDQEKGDSVEAQQARIEAYAKSLEAKGIQWGSFIAEHSHRSAFKHHFHDRPAGRELLRYLKRGDHLIIDKVDRIWRRVRDFVALIEMFRKIGVTLHFISFSGCSFEIGTPMGDFILNLFVSVAELESQRISERIKAAFKYKNINGKSTTWQHFGAKRIAFNNNGKKDSYFVWDEEVRNKMKFIYEMKTYTKCRMADVADQLAMMQYMEKGHSPEEARAIIRDTEVKLDWNYWRCHVAYHREIQYRYFQITDPNHICQYDVRKLSNHVQKRIREGIPPSRKPGF